MLTQLTTVKSRLALTVTDYDVILTNAIKAISARFDKETNRTLARTTTATHEFHAADTEILATLLLWNLKFGISPSSLLVFLSEKDYLLL